MIVNEYRPEVSREIRSLQTRANQLQTTSAACELRLTSLAVESEAARSANDGIALQKVGRKIHLEKQRAAHVASEIRTLLELIAARRSRYGLQPLPPPLPRLPERP